MVEVVVSRSKALERLSMIMRRFCLENEACARGHCRSKHMTLLRIGGFRLERLS
jgi:hypothetical protein